MIWFLFKNIVKHVINGLFLHVIGFEKWEFLKIKIYIRNKLFRLKNVIKNIIDFMFLHVIYLFFKFGFVRISPRRIESQPPPPPEPTRGRTPQRSEDSNKKILVPAPAQPSSRQQELQELFRHRNDSSEQSSSSSESLGPTNGPMHIPFNNPNSPEFQGGASSYI